MAEIKSSCSVHTETSRVSISSEVFMDYKCGKSKGIPVRLRLHFNSQMPNWKEKRHQCVRLF